MRPKLPAVQAALTRRFGAHHALLVGEVLSLLDCLDESIERLSAEIDRVIATFAEHRGRLATAPGDRPAHGRGHHRRDRRRHKFPTAAHLALWAGDMSPASTSRPASPATAPPVTATPGCSVISNGVHVHQPDQRHLLERPVPPPGRAAGQAPGTQSRRSHNARWHLARFSPRASSETTSRTTTSTAGSRPNTAPGASPPSWLAGDDQRRPHHHPHPPVTA
jgi:hypothetical protein